MTYAARGAWGSTVVFDGLAMHEATNNNNQSKRNGGNRRGAE